jgi:hypothetical protein
MTFFRCVKKREDILAYAFVRCRSNKAAPGLDGQDFVDIETYGGERWLGGGTVDHLIGSRDCGNVARFNSSILAQYPIDSRSTPAS